MGMRNKFVALFLVAIPLYSIGQELNIRTLDSLLLDANYQEVIRLTANYPNASTYSNVHINTKRVQAFIRSGKINEAREGIVQLQQNAGQLAEKKELAMALVNSVKGSLHMNEGRNDLALDAIQLSIESFDLSGNNNTLETADAIATLGIIYTITGKVQQAEEQLLKALSIRKSQLPEKHELIAASYNDLGLVYTSIDPDKSLEYYDQALEVYQQLHEETHPKIAIANTNLGVIYRELEFYGDAINSLETARDIWNMVYSQPHPSKALVLSNLGQTYLKMGDATAAEQFYNQSLNMYQESYGAKHPDIASTLNAMGNIKISQRKYNEALSFYQKALQANVNEFDNNDITVNPKVDNYYNGNVLLYTLLLKAEAFESRYLGETLKFSDLLLSIQSIQKCDTLIENLRTQITNESDKIALGTIASEVYANGVRIAHSLAMNAWKKAGYREMAFYFAEKSKSAVLQDAISDSNAKSFAGIPDELLEEEKYLKALTVYCNQQLAMKPSAEEEQSLRDILFKVNRDYETFVKNLEEKFPEYYNLKFNSNAASIPQIQSRLNIKTAVISYFMDEKNNRLYTFVITRSNYKILDNEIPADFDKQITGLRNSLFYNELGIYKSTADKLSKAIVPPVPGGITHLIIIPTGRMGVIPFEALFTRPSKNITDYSLLPYMLNQYSISYEFSAGLILQKNEMNQSPNTPPSILLCAPVEFTSNSKLGTLPGTEQEVNEIESLFADRKFKTEKLLRQNADEDNIKSAAIKGYRYLHFATHGIVDEENPELSRIFLNQGENEDGNLYSGEIYNLELDADLVTLSACETGLGKISRGEGVIGLSRALVYAGARRIIVSFWRVADTSTSQLMTDFYTQLLGANNHDFSGALRAAKRDMILKKTYAAPYYWAPFVIIGY